MSTITLIFVVALVAFASFVAGFFLSAALSAGATSDAWADGYRAGEAEARR